MVSGFYDGVKLFVLRLYCRYCFSNQRKKLAARATFVCFHCCCKISPQENFKSSWIAFYTDYGSKSSKTAWLQTYHLKSQLCTGKAMLQEMFQKAEYNNMKAKFCCLFNKWDWLSLKTKSLRNSLRSCKMPDLCRNRRPAIMCDDVYIRMSQLVDMFINRL